MTAEPVFGFRDVAALLGRSTDWLYGHLPELRRVHDFPPPIHGERPYVWVPAHVHAWLDRRLSPALAETVLRLRGAPPPADRIEGMTTIEVDQTRLHQIFAGQN